MMVNEQKGSYGMFSQAGKRTGGHFNMLVRKEELMEYPNSNQHLQNKNKFVRMLRL